jgi:hypothetical protein
MVAKFVSGASPPTAEQPALFDQPGIAMPDRLN